MLCRCSAGVACATVTSTCHTAACIYEMCTGSSAQIAMCYVLVAGAVDIFCIATAHALHVYQHLSHLLLLLYVAAACCQAEVLPTTIVRSAITALGAVAAAVAWAQQVRRQSAAARQGRNHCRLEYTVCALCCCLASRCQLLSVIHMFSRADAPHRLSDAGALHGEHALLSCTAPCMCCCPLPLPARLGTCSGRCLWWCRLLQWWRAGQCAHSPQSR
jgi:hypothetical protein